MTIDRSHDHKEKNPVETKATISLRQVFITISLCCSVFAVGHYWNMWHKGKKKELEEDWRVAGLRQIQDVWDHPEKRRPFLETECRLMMFRAQLCAELRQFQEAQEAFELARAIDPNGYAIESVPNLAETLARRKDYQRAVEIFEMYLHDFPEEQKALLPYATFLATSNNDDVRDGAKALELAERAMQLAGASPTRYNYWALSAALAELGDFDNATLSAQEALRLPPRTRINEKEEIRELTRLQKNIASRKGYRSRLY